jgi:NAD(P)H-dependent flavin oxidoreductase YrpB (nitropropane dioxygenase family)
MSATDTCPDQAFHGNPFRYCACGWMEDTGAAEGAKRTNDIENRFSFHPANTDEQRQQHESVRAACRTLAHLWSGSLPEGREKAVAITKLEEAMFWANAAIARSGGAS